MKILVIGGMHGNEPLGPAIMQAFTVKPIKNIDAVLANEPALRLNQRLTKQDLNRSFPGNKVSKLYEEKRAAELLEQCKLYDIVFDFHNTNCPDNDCSFLGETALPMLSNVSARLGLKRLIVADYDCINKFAPNCLSIEISISSNKMDVQYWYNALARLAQSDEVATDNKIEKYRFVYRMTLEDKEILRLDDMNLKAFQKIDDSLASAMGVGSPAFPIFIADDYTPYNYGGLLNTIL